MWNWASGNDSSSLVSSMHNTCICYFLQFLFQIINFIAQTIYIQVANCWIIWYSLLSLFNPSRSKGLFTELFKILRSCIKISSTLEISGNDDHMVHGISIDQRFDPITFFCFIIFNQIFCKLWYTLGV